MTSLKIFQPKVKYKFTFIFTHFAFKYLKYITIIEVPLIIYKKLDKYFKMTLRDVNTG